MTTRWSVDGLAVENHALTLMREITQYLSLHNGSVSIQMGQYEYLADALFGLIDHGYTIDDDTLFDELEESLRAIFKTDGTLSDAKKLLRELDRRCGILLANQSDYVLITSVSVHGGIPKARNINGCIINFHEFLPEKYRQARESLLQIPNPAKVNCENDGYLFVEVLVKSVNERTAFLTAAEALAVFRALCQLHLSKSVQMFLGPGLRHKYPTELAFRLGNIHTIHLPSGDKADEVHWYENLPNLSKPGKINQLQVIDERLDRQLLKLEAASREYRQFCLRSLHAFAEALDTRDAEAQFVKLWLCLELLTGADDAKQIIKRVSFFYGDQQVAAAQLRALRAARNSHVHAGAKPARMDMKNFRLAIFVENLLTFAIGNHFGCERASEWHEFMNTTTDVKSIDQQILRLEMVKKFSKPNNVELLDR